MTHSRHLHPAAAVKAPPCGGGGTPDPGFAGFGVANESLRASDVPNESFATSGPQARTSGPGSGAQHRRKPVGGGARPEPDPRPPWGACPCPAYRRGRTKNARTGPSREVVHI